MAGDTQQRIVVGVEGSDGSQAAFRWAIEEAHYRNAVVELVTAYLPTYVPAAPDFGYVPLDPVDLVDEVRRMQENVVTDAKALAAACSVTVEMTLVKGRPTDTLIEVSKGASLLVVGNRGHGGFRGLLLGSVSQQIAHHATCPVVIIRADMKLEESSVD